MNSTLNDLFNLVEKVDKEDKHVSHEDLFVSLVFLGKPFSRGVLDLLSRYFEKDSVLIKDHHTAFITGSPDFFKGHKPETILTLRIPKGLRSKAIKSLDKWGKKFNFTFDKLNKWRKPKMIKIP